MSLATFDAIAALVAAFDGAADLPALSENDTTLEGFAASGAEGVGYKLCLLHDDWRVDAVALGEPLQFEMTVPAEILFAVAGEPGDARDTVFAAGAASIAAILYPSGLPLKIAGKFDDLRIGDVIGRDHYAPESNAPPIEVMRLNVELVITAPTPFG